VELRSKYGTDFTSWYPEVAEALATIPSGPFIIGGEATGGV
jgi:ATP-dependent DNA ligase